MANLEFSKANRVKIIKSFPTKEMGKEDINEYGTIIKFFCQRQGEETILPKPKPKPKTDI